MVAPLTSNPSDTQVPHHIRNVTAERGIERRTLLMMRVSQACEQQYLDEGVDFFSSEAALEMARTGKAPTSDFLCTARVAPEKADFRPALPLHSKPEFTGEHMTKLTYSEQLKHPNWQRKRLEVLEHYGFRCFCCRSEDKTLHVHHKQYIKGRKAWEYEVENFEALCEDCHEEAHKAKELIDTVIAQYPSLMWHRLASLLVGYGEEFVDPAHWLQITDDFARAGRVAWYMGNLEPQDAFLASQVLCDTDPETFMEMVRERKRQQDDLLQAMERLDEKTRQQPAGEGSN